MPCYSAYESAMLSAAVSLAGCAAATFAADGGVGSAIICGSVYAGQVAIAEYAFANCMEDEY